MRWPRIALLSVVLALALLPALALHGQPVPAEKPGGTAAGEAATEEKKVTFCVFGDCRPENDPKRLQVLSTVARAMAQENPDVAIGTGDYIEGSTDLATVQQQYKAFFQALLPLQELGPVPLAAAPGNHDIRGSRANADLFTRYFGALHYSFDIEHCHFIILNTEEVGHERRIDGDQWQWLCQDLMQAQEARLIFVAFHRPLFPVDGHRGSSLDEYPLLRDRLHALFVQRGVCCVFAGHEHLYNYQQRDGVDYFITGGAGAPLYAKPQAGGFYHYLLAKVEGDKYTVSVRRIRP